MIHYFTLAALVREIGPILGGARIIEAWSQQKNELVIALERLAGRGDQEAPEAVPSLSVSVDPGRNHFYLREATSRARKNSVGLFPEISGRSIRRLGVQPYDRVVFLELDGTPEEGGASTLIVQLFNTAASNVVLLDAAGTVRNSFKRKGEILGTALAAASGGGGAGRRFDERVLGDAALFADLLRHTDPSLEILAALRQKLPFLGTMYAREILFAAGIDPGEAAAALPAGQVEAVHRELRDLLQRAASPEPRLYFRGRQPELLSLIPLRHQPAAGAGDLAAEKYETVNQAIAAFVRGSFRSRETSEKKGDLLGKLQEELSRARRSLTLTRQQLARGDGRAAEFDLMGRLVLANIHMLSRGMTQATVEDIVSGRGQVTIPLEPRLEPAENAGRYFEKAKKARIEQKESNERAGGLAAKADRVESLVREFEQAETSDTLREFMEKHRDDLIRMKLITDKPDVPAPPFRIFTVAGGFEVWVGKNSANNDLLTTEYAKPNDLWFHVRGAGGSHTVLKVGRGGAPPPREAIRQAAGIAAYYSKMRKAGTVTVAYCERKYVRKPKGSREGAVVIEREETVFVKPQLP